MSATAELVAFEMRRSMPGAAFSRFRAAALVAGHQAASAPIFGNDVISAWIDSAVMQVLPSSFLASNRFAEINR